MFWFETLTCSSSAFNCGSPKTSHHLSRMTLSCGCATFQPSVTLRSAGVSSLKAAGACAEGLTDLGPRVQPLNNSSRATREVAANLLRSAAALMLRGMLRGAFDVALGAGFDGG